MPISPDTLLRRVRTAPAPDHPTPRHLGVDDFALRKGQRYGTILVDLESHTPVDLLNDRTAEVLAAWLKAHPGVEVISRDRWQAYAQAARETAPDAVQVADRFHLVKNLGDAVERLLNRHDKQLQAAAEAVNPELRGSEVSTAGSPLSQPEGVGDGEGNRQCPAAETDYRLTTAVPLPALAPSQASKLAERATRRQRRLDRYHQVVELFQQGAGQRAISRRLGLSRKTVRRYLQAGDFPERATPQRTSGHEPFLPYLRERWAAGCHNSAELWRELQGLGYRGCQGRLRQALADWRAPDEVTRGRKSFATSLPAGQRSAKPSSRRAMWLLLRPLEELSDEEQRLRGKILELCAPAAQAQTLASDFLDLVHERGAEGLDDWLKRAEASQLAELKGFAKGIERDKDAVMAALTLEISNGQVEGQVNRLKCIKRQMYGRAKLDLLKARVIHGP